MIFSFSFLLYVAGAYAQITLEECQRKTQDNYPLVHQYDLVEKTKEYNLENAAKGYLPQFALSAKASYQSDVTEIPVKLPGVDLKGLPKDQYQVMLELQQKIWDGGGIRMQKKQTIAEAEVEKEKLNVDMYALNDRVNDLYFGILLLDEQIKQNTLLQDELERNYRQITAYVENGILSDTIENEGMAYLVSQIPDIIKQDQLNPNLTRSGEQRTTHVSIPLVKTEWNQHYPYNAQMPTNGKCSISYYYAGCIPIAVAQAITYYRKCPVAYDWDAFTVNTGIYDTNLIAPVSQFVKKVADGIKVGYKCDGTGAKNLGSTNDFLKGWGYNVERHKTNDVDKYLLYKCLITKNVVIFGGKKKKSTGHVWLVDGGVFEYSGNMMIGCTNIQVKAIHCNFGWNRANNGWYAIKDGAYNRPANSASQDGNNPTNDKNSPNGNFYTENDYIYFHEAMGTEILW